MDDTETRIGKDYAQHQAAIRTRRGKLQSLSPETPGYNDAFESMVKSVESLLEYEQRIPALREEPHRALSQRVVTWTAGVQAAGTVLVGLAVIPGLVGWGWLVLLVVHLMTVLNTWAQQVTPGQHRTMRHAAIAVNLLGVLAGVLAFGLISAWFTVLYLIAAAVTNVVMLDSDQAAAKEKTA